jgi:hypothetical protein
MELHLSAHQLVYFIPETTEQVMMNFVCVTCNKIFLSDLILARTIHM